MKKMVLVEVTKAYELQTERPSAERPTKGDLISESFSYCLKSQKKKCQITPVSILHIYYLYIGLRIVLVLRGVIWHPFFEI